MPVNIFEWLGIVAIVGLLIVVQLVRRFRKSKNRLGHYIEPKQKHSIEYPLWTNRFVVFPISVYNAKEQEITGNAESIQSYLKTLPTNIVEYRPTFLDSIPDKEVTEITRRNGDTIVILLSVSEFEETMNKFLQSFD